MPRPLGDSFIHVDDIDHLVPVDYPILESTHPPADQVARDIGRHIANLVEDGSTLQMGIGTIPDSVLYYLREKKDLGVHTEMFSDGMMHLVELGVITNMRKTIHKGKVIASFCMGTRKLYEFVDNNPLIEFHPNSYTNDPFVIAQNDRMVSINSALQVDLTGQVCADSLGHMFYSGIGGQLDFVRGAARAKGGKPIIALPSTAQDGAVSRISPQLNPGAGVVTTRGDVHCTSSRSGASPPSTAARSGSGPSPSSRSPTPSSGPSSSGPRRSSGTSTRTSPRSPRSASSTRSGGRRPTRSRTARRSSYGP